jgi:hypothetical protein
VPGGTSTSFWQMGSCRRWGWKLLLVHCCACGASHSHSQHKWSHSTPHGLHTALCQVLGMTSATCLLQLVYACNVLRTPAARHACTCSNCLLNAVGLPAPQDELLALSALCELKARDDAAQGESWLAMQTPGAAVPPASTVLENRSIPGVRSGALLLQGRVLTAPTTMHTLAGQEAHACVALNPMPTAAGPPAMPVHRPTQRPWR